MQILIAQKQDRGRALEQMLVSRASGHAYRQTEHAGVFTIRFVKEALAAKLALRSAFTDEFVGYFRRFAQTHCTEVQVLTVGSHHNRVGAEGFDSIDAVSEREFGGLAVCPAH